MSKKIKMMCTMLVLVLLVSTIALSGCGKSPEASSPESEKTEAKVTAEVTAEEATPEEMENVEIRAAWWGDTSRNEMYGQICDVFEENNPGITVVPEPLSWTDYWDKLTVQSASGGAPDFMGMHPNFANDYVRRNVLLPLDDFVSEGTINLADFSQGAIESGTVDGVNYMISMGITGQSIFVNKTLLDEYGIDMPSFDWTWDDLETIGAQATEAFRAAGQDDMWFISDNTRVLVFFRYWARQNGRDIYASDGEIEFTEEDASTWYAMWKNLREKDIVPDAATSIEYIGATLEESLFIKGNIALTPAPANQYKQFSTALPDAEIIMIRNPSKVGGKTAEYTEGAHFAISANTTPEKQSAAAKLINFWVNTEESMAIFGLDQGVPANTKMAEFVRPTLDEYQSNVMDFINKVSAIATSTTFPPAGASEVNSEFERFAEMVMFDSMSPEEAAVDYVAKAKTIVSE